MKNGWQSFVMMLGLLLVLGPMVHAQQPMPGGPDGDAPEMDCADDRPEAGPMRWMQDLNLTDDQVSKLKAERVKRQKESIKLRAEMESMQIDLWQEVSNDNPNLGKIEGFTKQIGELHGKIMANRISSVIFLRSILSPEQKKKLDSMGVGTGMGMGMLGKKGPGRHHRMMKDRK